MLKLSVAELENKVEKIFQIFGHNNEDAKLAAKALVAADLWGISSHGVRRLSYYAAKYKDYTIKPNAIFKTINETPSTLTLDANGGLGLIVGQRAIKIAIEKAKKYGTGWIAIRNSSHFGCGSYHAQFALSENMIGIVMTNASPIVSPTGSCERIFGTNPLTVSFPTSIDCPFNMDFSTSMTTCGYLEESKKIKTSLPLGIIIDTDGRHTTNINALDQEGCILPMGYSKEFDNSHKGYGLCAMVDLFCGVLSGANYGKWVPSFTVENKKQKEVVGSGIGHFIGVLDVNAFRPVQEYFTHMSNWLYMIKNSKRIDPKKEIFIPGEIEARKKTYHEQEGIIISKAAFDFIDSFGPQIFNNDEMLKQGRS
jgi:LDH2 family malate/lactate/ureidoglycolate dehydrogenase